MNYENNSHDERDTKSQTLNSNLNDNITTNNTLPIDTEVKYNINYKESLDQVKN